MTAVAVAPSAEQSDVAAAVRGDEAAFERLYRTHVSRVTSLARWLLGTDEVEDAVQEVFIRVWEKLGTYSGQAQFGTWLHRVAVNHMIRRRQRRSIHKARHTEDEEAMMAAAEPDPTVGLYSATALSQGILAQDTMYAGVSQIVQGRRPVSDLDGIVREWRNQAGDKIRAEFQDALEANKKAGG